MRAATPRASSGGILDGSGGVPSNSKELTPTGTGPTRQSSSSWSSSSSPGEDTYISLHSRSGTCWRLGMPRNQ